MVADAGCRYMLASNSQIAFVVTQQQCGRGDARTLRSWHTVSLVETLNIPCVTRRKPSAAFQPVLEASLRQSAA
jgi:hypothetical protein